MSNNSGQSFGPSQTIRSTGYTYVLLSLSGPRLHAGFLDRDLPTRGVYSRRSRLGPVVFVPGVAGSVLFDQNADEELWPALTGHMKISLHLQDNPDQYQIVATDPIREVQVGGVTVTEIYGPFLSFLSEELGFHPYELAGSEGTFFPGATDRRSLRHRPGGRRTEAEPVLVPLRLAPRQRPQR